MSSDYSRKGGSKEQVTEAVNTLGNATGIFSVAAVEAGGTSSSTKAVTSDVIVTERLLDSTKTTATFLNADPTTPTTTIEIVTVTGETTVMLSYNSHNGNTTISHFSPSTRLSTLKDATPLSGQSTTITNRVTTTPSQNDATTVTLTQHRSSPTIDSSSTPQASSWLGEASSSRTEPQKLGTALGIMISLLAAAAWAL